MGDFEFPTNVKQIGSIGEGIRIYMEDYAYSYLQQFTEAGGYEERLAFLVGREMKIDGQTVLFISGAMQGLYTSVERDIMMFTDKSWQYAREQLKKYFKGMEIVGWVHAQPGYGIHLNSSVAMYHMKTFLDSGQVLFVMDPAEKINVFYMFNEETAEMVETKGYFIYFDKNRSMHEYMLDNKVVKIKMEAVNEPEPPMISVGEKIGDEPEIEERRHHPSRVKKAIKLEQLPHKKAISMLGSLCAVLFAVCFIMGISLIQNDERITVMEDQMTALNTSYRDLMLDIKNGNAESVFAEQDQMESQNGAMVITENGNEVLQNETLIAEVATPTEMVMPATTPEAAVPTPAPTPVPTPAPTPMQTESQTTENQEQIAEPVVQEVVSQQQPNIPETYVVQEGDSLSYISYKFYGTNDMVEQIMTVNGMSDPNTIYFGKVLKLPQL